MPIKQHELLIHIGLMFAIILLEGFVTISVEILTIRQLIPFVGSNVIVTSLIIGVFLLFLALGYRRGGYYTENYQEILKKNFTWASIWLGIGLSYLFVELFFMAMRTIGLISPLIVLSIYLLLVIAPLVYILGQTVPITTNLFKKGHSVGKVSGKVLYLSTIGSFLGAILTSLFLLNFLGVAWSVVVNFFLLFVLTLMMLRSATGEWLRIVILLLGFLVVLVMNVNTEKIMFIKTNNYANYAIIDDFSIRPGKQGKVFSSNNSASSFLTAEGEASPYIERIKAILFEDLQLTDKAILVIGAAGFTLTAQGDFGNHFTYVDIDKDVLPLSQEYFNNNIHGEFIAADVRSYLNQLMPAQYDVIVADAYTNVRSIPSQLLTREYMLQLREAIKENGLVLLNIIASPYLNDHYSKRIDNTISSVFSSCMKIPADYIAALTNILYVCNDIDDDTSIYTDDLNKATLDFFAVVQ